MSHLKLEYDLIFWQESDPKKTSNATKLFLKKSQLYTFWREFVHVDLKITVVDV